MRVVCVRACVRVHEKENLASAFPNFTTELADGGRHREPVVSDTL
jgi:hypothetical protein